MRKSHFSRSAVAALLAAVTVFCSLSPGVRAATSSEIKDEITDLKVENAVIQAQIDAIRSQYNATASEIQALVDKKNAVDQEIALLHEQIINVNEQLRIYGQMIADTQERLDESNAQLTSLNKQYKDRIQAMEEEGEVTYWQVIFQSKSFTDFLDRMNIVDEIAAADTRRLVDLQVAAANVEENQRILNEEMADLQETRQMLSDSEAMLEEKRTESDDILRELIAKQEEFQVVLDQSEALQNELMNEIAQKQKELQAAQYKEELVKMALRGENPPSNATWLEPVSGYTITSAFGYRKAPTKGASTYHQGIDMACPTGTPIYATRSGTVTTASYQAGGAGYYVSINHGDGFASIYMHMTRYVVAKGQSVSQGQLIGYVGSTGVSTGPHLHFGISYGGTYVNPMAYL
ncbi:MAG: peptidoglycan DD-metalloendopeptidase family protein [Candidatus Faecousia sp.]|nr:peptidoglycan DD-metalloendopeptidase family protein [Bacillota bacterium]MDY4755161.1 peptidoglycan DD-metalloendopeptidase family protein [Candidatus Faecousia sp.]MDY6161266.1 peptidoglycan DD-metalloendopeptidase family protein [Candidatus Faecousia sp.]